MVLYIYVIHDTSFYMGGFTSNLAKIFPEQSGYNCVIMYMIYVEAC